MGFNAGDPATTSEIKSIGGSATTIAALAFPPAAPFIAIGTALASVFSSLFGGTKQLTQQEILDAITPAVVNDLQNQGLVLPLGQEEQYVAAALSGQLGQPQVNYWVPMGIAGLAGWILLSGNKS
jgi:hypothetical protein